MPPPIVRTIASPVGKDFVARIRRRVRLGPLCLEICSNDEHFSGMRYFPESARLNDNTPIHYQVSFCELSLDGFWPLQTLLEAQDPSYRANRFAMGYYITDHFGPPAYLVTQGTHYWIFGTNFESILWPYIVKLLLTLYSMEHGMLHLKAASVAVEGEGTLLVARGGGGKTVLLAELCRAGAQFLSNTHVLIDERAILAVPTAMRVRNDARFAPIIAARHLPAAIKTGEYTADPLVDLGWQTGMDATPKNICLVDYRGTGNRIIREMDRDVLFNYMEQFSLALNVYGLKEDLLDHLDRDVMEFSVHMTGMKTKLRALVDRCRAYYVSCDATDPRNLETLCKLLGPSNNGSAFDTNVHAPDSA
jgi:hypothetical protein